jgi:hypothetical protein
MGGRDDVLLAAVGVVHAERDEARAICGLRSRRRLQRDVGASGLLRAASREPLDERSAAPRVREDLMQQC